MNETYEIINFDDTKDLSELSKRDLKFIQSQNNAHYLQKTKKYVDKINEISSYVSVIRFIIGFL